MAKATKKAPAKKKTTAKKTTARKTSKSTVKQVEEKAYEAANEIGKVASKAASKENLEAGVEYTEKFAHGIKSNSHMILGVVLLLIGVFILRDIIVKSLEIAVGIAFILLAYLVATDFFKKDEHKKAKKSAKKAGSKKK